MTHIHEPLPDLSGRKMGAFQVLDKAGLTKKGALLYWIKCLTCGEERPQKAQNLRKWPTWRPRCKCGATS